MADKYKLETWKQYKWKGTPRETLAQKQVLVKRDSKGHFAKNTPVITEIREKTYGTGLYIVGISNGKVVTRLKKSDLTQEWKREHAGEIRERMKSGKMYRCSLALNDIPYRGTEYYGFRIVAFSRRKEVLQSVYPSKMYSRLIKFIEDCLHYRKDSFWFEHYLNYMGKVKIEPSNGTISDNNKYYLLWTKRKSGIIKRQDSGYVNQL